MLENYDDLYDFIIRSCSYQYSELIELGFTFDYMFLLDVDVLLKYCLFTEKYCISRTVTRIVAINFVKYPSIHMASLLSLCVSVCVFVGEQLEEGSEYVYSVIINDLQT